MSGILRNSQYIFLNSTFGDKNTHVNAKILKYKHIVSKMIFIMYPKFNTFYSLTLKTSNEILELFHDIKDHISNRMPRIIFKTFFFFWSIISEL